MHSGAEISSLAFGDSSNEVGGTRESQRCREAANSRDDLPLQRLQGFVDGSLVTTSPGDLEAVRGALEAARWIHGRKGWFGMTDLIQESHG